MRGELVAVALGAEAVEVAVVGMLQHLRSDNTRHKCPVTDGIAGCLNPDSYVYRNIEKKT